MNYIDDLISKIKKEDRNNEQSTFASFVNPKLAFCGDIMNKIMSTKKCKISEIGEKMGLERRVFQYIRSRNAKNRRDITFFEVLRFCIAMNFSLMISLEFLRICGFCLNNGLERDRIISIILEKNHNNTDEEIIRMDAINLIEVHYCDLNFDYCEGFKKIRNHK